MTMQDNLAAALELATILTGSDNAQVSFGRDLAWLSEGMVQARAVESAAEAETFEEALRILLSRLRDEAESRRRVLRLALLQEGSIDLDTEAFALWSAICGAARVVIQFDCSARRQDPYFYEVATIGPLGRKGPWTTGNSREDAMLSLIRSLRRQAQEDVDRLTSALAKVPKP